MADQTSNVNAALELLTTGSGTNIQLECTNDTINTEVGEESSPNIYVKIRLGEIPNLVAAQSDVGTLASWIQGNLFTNLQADITALLAYTPPA